MLVTEGQSRRSLIQIPVIECAYLLSMKGGKILSSSLANTIYVTWNGICCDLQKILPTILITSWKNISITILPEHWYL